MNMRKQNPIYVLIFLVIVGAFLSNRFIISVLNKNAGDEQAKHRPTVDRNVVDTAISIADVPEQGLELEDPKKYGMLVDQRYEFQFGQQQWDQATTKVITETNVKQGLREQSSFRGNLLSAAEYKKRLALVEQQITDCEKELKTQPLNSALNQKLQNLYMLKSTLTHLREDVVKQ